MTSEQDLAVLLGGESSAEIGKPARPLGVPASRPDLLVPDSFGTLAGLECL